eukprot:TRINITY_DN12135_c1_g2_i1.p1 TRINITY_DN12135_c1_g2~~TRINITY_DN12135_c1_g2_i1.p1  ORF type:complete len:301 (+),score=76.53 TRINITY_DN12135_c1_g2_i1:51-953(+)
MSFAELLKVEQQASYAYEEERKKQIESLQDMREINSSLFSVMYEEVRDQDYSIKKMSQNVSSTVTDSLEAVKELATAKKNKYGMWKTITYGIGGGVVAGVAGVCASVPLAAAAAGGAIVAGGTNLVYSRHKKRLCRKEINRLIRLRDEINTKYEVLFTPQGPFEGDDLECDNDAVRTQKELLRQGEYLSAIRYQLLDVYAILVAKTSADVQLSYPELEKYELETIKQYKQDAKEVIDDENKEEVLDSIHHNVAQDKKVAENIGKIIPRQIAACVEIEQKIAEVLQKLQQKIDETQDKLDR